MTPPHFGLRRHLSYANVMASIAVFVALGGGAYAAVTIDGKDIRSHSIAGKKLKHDTLTGKQINERRLGRVPRARAALRARNAIHAASADSATTAASAGSATTATTANSANTAGTATTASTAGSANTADSATTAGSATSAKTADSAGTAGSATTAGHALSADTAGDADTLNGFSSSQLLVSCPADTSLFGGVCWDDNPRPPVGWIGAAITCADAGGRLPSLGELVAYLVADGDSSSPSHWSSEVESVTAGVANVVRQDDTASTVEASNGNPFGYRCVFYRAN